MDQDRNVPDIAAGNDDDGGVVGEPAAVCRSVFDAGVDAFTGSLVLQGAEVLDQEQAGAVLSRLDQLGRWVQAQQAKVLQTSRGVGSGL